MKTKSFDTNFTVEGEAARLTRKDLEAYARDLCIKFPGHHRKAEIAAGYAHYILGNVGNLLAHASEWDVALMRDLVQSGPGKGVAVRYLPPVLMLPYLLLLKIVPDEDSGLVWFVMPDELRKAIGAQSAEGRLPG